MRNIYQLSSFSNPAGTAITVTSAFSSTYLEPAAAIAGSYAFGALFGSLRFNIEGHAVGASSGITWGSSTLTNAGLMVFQAGGSVIGGSVALSTSGRFDLVNHRAISVVNGTAVSFLC